MRPASQPPTAIPPTKAVEGRHHSEHDERAEHRGVVSASAHGSEDRSDEHEVGEVLFIARKRAHRQTTLIAPNSSAQIATVGRLSRAGSPSGTPPAAAINVAGTISQGPRAQLQCGREQSEAEDH
jgi:hypothetical protein